MARESTTNFEAEARRLADEHWAFLVRWMEMIYKDSFIHGFGHGEEDGRLDQMEIENHDH